VVAQRQGHALAAGGHGDALGHGELGGKASVGGAHVEARHGLFGHGPLPGHRGGRRGRGHGHRGGCHAHGLRWRGHIQRPGARQSALGGAAGLAGGQHELHVAPVFAAVLCHQGLAFEQHGGLGRVQRGAVGRLPAGAAHLVGQAQLAFALGRQVDADRHHARALAGHTVALGHQGLQGQLQRLLLAPQLVRAGQCVLARFAQHLGHGGDLRRRGVLCTAAGGIVAPGAAAGHALEVAVHQVQRTGFGLHAGNLVLQLTDAAVQRAGTGGGHVAVLGEHVEFAHAHAGIGMDLQALRIEGSGQATEGEAARTHGDLGHALHGGGARIDGDAGDARVGAAVLRERGARSAQPQAGADGEPGGETDGRGQGCLLVWFRARRRRQRRNCFSVCSANAGRSAAAHGRSTAPTLVDSWDCHAAFIPSKSLPF